MCGISGIFNRDGSGIDRFTLERMTDAIRHRGPDGNGYLIDGEIERGAAEGRHAHHPRHLGWRT